MRLAWITTEHPSFAVRYCGDILLPYLERAFEVHRNPDEETLASCDASLFHFDDSVGAESLASDLGKGPSIVWIHEVLKTDGRHQLDDTNELSDLGTARTIACSNLRNANELEVLCKELKFTLPQRRILLPYPATCPNFMPEKDSEGRQVVAFAGAPAVESRAHKLLDAIRSLGKGQRLLWMVEEAEREKAELMCAEFSLEQFEIFSPKSSKTWSEILSRSSCAVHTHYSAYSDPGPLLAMSLLSGTPSLVSNFSSTACLPDAVVRKLQAGLHEDTQIREFLMAAPVHCQASRDYALERHSAEKIAEELLVELSSVAGS